MTKKCIQIAWMLFLTISANSQEIEQTELIRELGIVEMVSFDFSVENGKIGEDSILGKKQVFNKWGLTSQKFSYRVGKQEEKEEYLYKEDTLLIERNYVYTNPDRKVVTKSVFKYGNNGKIKSEIFYDRDRKTLKRKYEYNDLNLLVNRITKTKQKSLIRKEISDYFYNDQNQLIKIESNGFTFPAIELKYDSLGNHFETNRIDHSEIKSKYLEKEYDKNGRLILKRLYYQEASSILGYEGKIDVNVGDVLVKEFIRSENGLIQFEKQFLNDELVSLRKNNYAL